MPFNNPRTYEYLREGIAWSRTAQELDRLDVFARAHFTGLPLKELQKAIANQRVVISTSNQRSAVPVHRLRDPLERMMDEIMAATSVAEIDHLSREVEVLFVAHPRRDDLELALDGKRRLLARGLGT